MVRIIQKGDLSNLSFANDDSNNAGGVTVRVDPGSTVGDALAAAIAALPGDVFLQGLQSYNPTTNVLTLNMSNGATVDVDLTGLLDDAVDTITDGKTAVYGNDSTTLLGYLLPT